MNHSRTNLHAYTRRPLENGSTRTGGLGKAKSLGKAGQWLPSRCVGAQRGQGVHLSVKRGDRGQNILTQGTVRMCRTTRPKP